MTCSKCGAVTRRYRIVEHRLLRDVRGKLIGVENVPVCLECIEKEKSENGIDSKPSCE